MNRLVNGKEKKDEGDGCEVITHNIHSAVYYSVHFWLFKPHIVASTYHQKPLQKQPCFRRHQRRTSPFFLH
ncbi:hypothetical protein L6452_39419 [Arctium lappa]|uniref:Uncharacterized protein n=1 Tax=Arctium lappa TaxID=4217 RepID=A0ACB8XSP6_ARCLA|nr:hypothetical protein L6452_39419 [Arctium lappa]